MLYRAVESNNFEIVNLLLQCKNIDANSGYLEEVNKDYYEFKSNKKIIKSPLYKAIENENIEMVRLLLSSDKIDVNHINETQNYIPNSEILEEDKKELEETKQDKQLYYYEESGYKSYDDCIMDFYGKERIKETALCLAVRQNNNEIIQLLLSHDKININIPYELYRKWEFVNCGDDSNPLNFREIKKTYFVYSN